METIKKSKSKTEKTETTITSNEPSLTVSEIDQNIVISVNTNINSVEKTKITIELLPK